MGFRNTGVTCKRGFIQDSRIEIEDLGSAYTVYSRLAAYVNFRLSMENT